ncbi:hypothetical protein [Marinobacter sp. JSM 1782161]|uniref:hypothetical protein n=1 Tax=Marinobacter sp. JSM 1782161 TaxID=2685906 RepID=UPI0014021368|nr:hypothetical protein [Marinobacter sp. JSM 1782161]
MKRRDLIKRGLIASAAMPGVANANLLYGSPNSVKPVAETHLELSESKKNAIKYSLSRLDIPPEHWDKIVKTSSIWSELNNNEALRDYFISNPREALASYGLSPEELELSDFDMRMLQLTFRHRDLLDEGRFDDFIDVLILDSKLDRTENTFQKRLEKSLEQNSGKLDRLIESGVIDPRESAGMSPTLQYFSDQQSSIHRLERLAEGTVSVVTTVTDVAAAVNTIVAVNVSVLGNSTCRVSPVSTDSLLSELTPVTKAASRAGYKDFEAYVNKAFAEVLETARDKIRISIERVDKNKSMHLTAWEKKRLEERLFQVASKGII